MRQYEKINRILMNKLTLDYSLTPLKCKQILYKIVERKEENRLDIEDMAILEELEANNINISEEIE